MSYWLTPVGPLDEAEPPEVVSRLVGELGIFAFGERNPGRRRMKTGDWIAFYARGLGVVGHARIAGRPELKTHEAIPEQYKYLVQLEDASIYADSPVPLDETRRGRLDGLRGRGTWSWFVQSTKEVSPSDFKILTASRR